MVVETNRAGNSPEPTQILNARMFNYETGFTNPGTILGKIYDVAL